MNAIAMLIRCGKYQNMNLVAELVIPAGSSEWNYTTAENLTPSDTGRADAVALSETFWE